MKKKSFWLIGAVVFTVMLAAVGTVVYLKTRPNPHYLLGIKYLEMKEFDRAIRELNLCLDEEKDNQDARALILYGHLRQAIIQDGTPAGQFMNDIVHGLEKELSALIANDDFGPWNNPDEARACKNEIQVRRFMLREKLRHFKIHTTSWDSAIELAQRFLRRVYKLKVDPEDGYDVFFHALSASLLAYQGDKACARDLLQTARQNFGAGVFLHFAGKTIVPYLRAELKNKESLLGQNAMPELRNLVQHEPINQFLKAHPNLRRMRRSDFEGKDTFYFARTINAWKNSVRFDFVNDQWYLDLERKQELDPCSLWLKQVSWYGIEHTQDVLVVSGFDGQKRRFCGQFFIWNDESLSWQQLNLKMGKKLGLEFENKHVFTLAEEVDTNKQRLTLRLYHGATRQVSTIEARTEQVTRYREVQDLLGGISSIAYTSTEEVPYEIKKTKDIIICQNLIFQFDPDHKLLEYVGQNEEVSYFDP